MGILAGVALAVVALALPGAAADEPAAPAAPATASRGHRNARSVGTPSAGHLENGRRLRESTAVAYLAAAAPRGRHYGTEELVGVIERGAAAVARAFPGSTLRVGDLSAKSGGEVHMHASHESGRDADVAFYLRSPTGEDARPPRFVGIVSEGKSADGTLVFDAARNWAFIAAILTDRRASVTHVFVADPLKALLLAEARRSDAPERLVSRAESLLSQPRGSFPHDNHFHLRVACAPDDRPECQETPRRRPPPGPG